MGWLDELVYGIRDVYVSGVELTRKTILDFRNGLTASVQGDTIRVEPDVAVLTEAVVAAMGDTGERAPVRCVATSLAACTRTDNDLEADANGAIGAQDGVTLVVGDRVLIAGATGDDKDNWIHDVVSVGAAGAKWKLTRSSDSDTTAKVFVGCKVYVEEGATNKYRVFTAYEAGTLNSGDVVVWNNLSTSVVQGATADGLSLTDGTAGVTVANGIVSIAGLLNTYSRTVLQLNALAKTAGQIAWCSDEATGACLVVSDGSNWVRAHDKATIS